jgi:hypothetical protein
VANYRVSTEYKKRTIIQQAKQNSHNETRQKKRKNDQSRLFKRKYEFLNISTNLRTEFAVRTHLAVGQWLEEQLNVEKFRMFRVETRKPTASRTEGQNLAPLKTFIKNRASM